MTGENQNKLQDQNRKFSLFLLLIVTAFVALLVFQLGKLKNSPADYLSRLQNKLAAYLPPGNREGSDPEKMPESARKVRVSRIIDGDTIEIDGGQKVRYIGINTPETHDPRLPVQCFGKEASDKNSDLVLGKDVYLEKDVSETDKYGRLLRYVWVDNVMVNEFLVKAGFAHMATYPPDVKYRELFQDAENSARTRNLGLWNSCKTNSPLSPAAPVNTESNRSLSQNCLIKANISFTAGEKIYHLPGCEYYDQTVIDESKGERWFCTEKDAVTAGWRKAENCP